MQSPKRDAFSTPLPPALIYAAALTCGVLAALALEIYLTGAGFDPANLWENFLSSGTRDLRTAGPWWGIAALAFIVSGITAAALSRFPPRVRGRGGRCERRGSLDCALPRSADGPAWSLCRSATLIGASSTSIIDC